MGFRLLVTAIAGIQLAVWINVHLFKGSGDGHGAGGSAAATAPATPPAATAEEPATAVAAAGVASGPGNQPAAEADVDLIEEIELALQQFDRGPGMGNTNLRLLPYQGEKTEALLEKT